MSKRNLVWLVAIIAVGAVLWIAAGWLWGVIAAVAILVASEVVERNRRKKLRASRGDTSKHSVLDTIKRDR